MLKLISAKFAQIEELFEYKEQNIILPSFPGYTTDQWGIKAHNRPWIIETGKFRKNLKILEVGGAYSTLPEYLANKYHLEAWIGDDFGASSKEKIWSRWGNPKIYAKKHKKVKYIYQPFGAFSDEYPDSYFDRIFSVSTLEHIHPEKILNVFKDMNRCTKKGGIQLHSIDITVPAPEQVIKNAIYEKYPIAGYINKHPLTELQFWQKVIIESGIEVDIDFPNSFQLLSRNTLVESPDVVYRFYPPNNAKKAYSPTASLLLVIKNI